MSEEAYGKGELENPKFSIGEMQVARSIAKTPRDLREGMRLVKECLRIIWDCQYDIEEGKRSTTLKFWTIENPATGMLRNFLGNPAFKYCPSEYGADFTKQTALWGKFNLPKKPFFLMNPIIKNSLASGKGREAKTAIMKYKGTWQEKRIQQMHERSTVYEPFALAFFEENQ